MVPVEHGSPWTLAVIGADGFIGSAVTRRALAEDGSVTAVCVKDPWRLAEAIAEPGLRIVRVPSGRWWEAGFVAELAPAIEHCDAVALLAYTPPPGQQSPLADERAVNVAGAGAIGGIAAEIGRPLVFASSADVYGDWHDEPVDELTTPRPRTPYARAKLEAEERLRAAGPEIGILRLSTVFGPGEDGPRAIPSFIRALLEGEAPVVHGAGTDAKDYIHVDDVAAAIVAACRRPPPMPINVGSGVGRTTREVLEAVALAIGVEARARHVASPRAPTRLVLDNARARLRLGLDPRRDFVAALGEEAEWLARKRGVTVEVGA